METVLLRSPPFPFVNADVAAVTVRVSPLEGKGHKTEDDAVVDALLRSMAECRVGGDFWGARPMLPNRIKRWAQPETSATAEALLATLAGDGADVAVTLPRRRWTRRAAGELRALGCHVLIGPHDPWHILAQVDSVIVNSAGDEAAILGLAAGCRLVSDRGITPPPSEVRAAASEQLLHAVRYRDPFADGAAATPQRAVELLTFWRGELSRNLPFAVACAIAPWKRRNVRQMLWNGITPLRFRWRSAAAVRLAAANRGAVVVWAAKAPSALAAHAAQAGVSIGFVEDGFIRSTGLGSDCVPPQSITIDQQRPHYDPSGPSDLEAMIESGDAAPETISLARRLTDRIVGAGLGKYGGSRGAAATGSTHGRKMVLVTGQVEDDASVLAGNAGVDGNLDLLRRARAAEPEAFLVYRPHPDVEAAHRKGAIDDRDALRFADCVDRETALNTLFDRCDAVHVLTSLAGFEALLRGKEVVTHGAPFYSGWGLTRDLAPRNPRRNRTVALEALFACAILRYPRYLDPRTMLPCPAEILVDRLINKEVQSVSVLTRFRRLRRLPLLRRAFGR